MKAIENAGQAMKKVMDISASTLLKPGFLEVLTYFLFHSYARGEKAASEIKEKKKREKKRHSVIPVGGCLCCNLYRFLFK